MRKHTGEYPIIGNNTFLSSAPSPTAPSRSRFGRSKEPLWRVGDKGSPTSLSKADRSDR